MSDITPRPEDENPQVPPASAGTPQQPEPPAAPPVPPQPTAAYPPPAAPSYGAPAAGGYPPPGQVPPGAYGASQVSVGDAFNYGWTKFTQNVGGIILGVVLYVLAFLILSGIFFAILVGVGSAASPDGDNSGLGALFGFTGLLFMAVVALLTVLMQAGVIRACLEISYGRKVDVKTFFQFTDLGKLVLAALLVGVLTAVGYMLCFIPGLVFAFFAQFTLFFVIDKGLSPVDALKASFSLVNKNLGTVIALFVGVLIANVIGELLCGVGTLVALPVGLLATTFVYRRLLGEQVAA